MKVRTILTAVLFIAAALLVLAPTEPPPDPPPSCPWQPRTPGYWKNHPDAWPVDKIKIGDKWYWEAKEEPKAIPIMKTPGKGDKTYTMFKALVAAKLNMNMADGCKVSCIKDTIEAADKWMTTYGPVGSDVRGNSKAWKMGEPLYEKLDDYNNYGCSD
jgi:hypothetical protein